jgi:hypothetical protein
MIFKFQHILFLKINTKNQTILFSSKFGVFVYFELTNVILFKNFIGRFNVGMKKEEIMEYSKYPKSLAASLMGITVNELTDECKKNGKATFQFLKKAFSVGHTMQTLKYLLLSKPWKVHLSRPFVCLFQMQNLQNEN